MRDRLLIVIGLVLFMTLVTYPVWHGVGAGTSTARPEVKLPTQAKQCVAPLDYMRKAHMDLLIQWREGKVRNHQLRYTAYDGKTYEVSLTRTCLTQCHGSKTEFCDNCHKYAAVSGPFCWDCHTDVGKTQVSSAALREPGAPKTQPAAPRSTP